MSKVGIAYGGKAIGVNITLASLGIAALLVWAFKTGQKYA